MIIPFGCSGGRQLISTEDVSSTFSCSSSGGEKGPGGRGSGSVIGDLKWAHTAVPSTICFNERYVWQPSVLVCPYHLGPVDWAEVLVVVGQGQMRNEQGLRWWHAAVENNKGWLVLIMPLKVDHSDLAQTGFQQNQQHLGFSVMPQG